MDFDQTQAIYDYEEEEEEQVKQVKTHAKKKEVAVLKVFSQQGFKETFFPIFLGDNVIGRDGKCNITIPIKALSKKHACIEVQRDLHLIYDCESKNRTKKGKSLLKPTIRYELKHGDMLTFGDVKCQYVVDLDTEEDEGDETGSETESESMLPEATTEEELDGDKPIVHEDVPIISNAKRGPPGDELRQPVQVSQITKKPAGEGEEEAYMYAADSDTDDERPLAAAAMLTVLYSSEEEHETPVRQKTTKVHMKQKNSMEGQTLAFGLGSPDNVFRNRDSSGSSHAGQTAGSIPQTLMLSSDSDAQSDGKGGQLPSGNRRSSAPKHPEAPHNTANQPTCEPTLVYESDGESPMKRPTNRKAIVSDPSCQPTLLYGSESDDGSPLKKPRHPEADVSKELDPTCPPTLPCETEDGSPVKKPTYRGVANVPTALNESDFEESTDNAADDCESNKHIQQVVSSSPGIAVEDKRDDNQMQSVSGEAEATVLYAAAEMSSTDDEGEPETNADVEKPTDHKEPTQLLYSTEKAGERKLNDDDNMVTDEYGDDCATQPYAMDSDFNTERATIPVVGVDTSDANQTTKLSDVEATQAYCVEDEKEEEEEDSNSSNSQPLPIGPTSEADQGDIAAATLAYGLEATQAYNATEQDDETDDEQGDRGSHCNDADPTLAYDLQSTQAYGVSKEDDNTDDEDNDKNESHRERVEGQSCELGAKIIDGRDAVQATIPYGLESTQAYGVGEGDNTGDEDNDKNESRRERVEGKSCELETKVNGRGDAVQATMPYGLESTQAYGADETDDEDSKDWDMEDSRGDKSRGDRVALASGLAETLPYGGHDDDDDDEDKDGENENKEADEHMRQENQATLAYGLEETQAYDAESNDTDSASYSAIEATQAYGIEEPFEAEVQTKPQKDAVKKVTTKRVAFAGSSPDEKDDETSATETGEQNQPSTSSAADMEEEFQESEDFIQPRSRSRRGRKKLVIEESQEDESQQTSERSSSSKGKSNIPNTKGNEQSQVKNAVTDSPSDTTKQVQATCQGLEDETPTITAASRKGRRGAMRVTIEADESDEEDISQESSTKRSRGKKAVQEESNKNGRSSTAGRKRGRKASKVTVEESAVEVKETPAAPKSRRGRKGKADRSEAFAVSVSETPLKVTLDTTGAADPQEPTATDVESTNTRRGGRGRGRKGTAATVKETPQTTDSITLEASVTSTEVRSQASAAPPARGKGRGRGKKTQSLSTEMEIPEATSAIDEEEQQPSESPAVNVASKGRGRGRQGRGKRTQPSRSAALESSEGVSQILSTPESSEGSQTRKGRGRGKVSSEQEPSSDVEVAETPAKKSRRGKEPSVAQSPSLRQGKQPAESNPRVIFTGLVDKQGEKVVTSLGGELVNNIHDCTHLVTDKVRRTVKFLCGLASGQVIVLPSWLDACKRAKSFVDTTPFLVKDKEAEKQYKFDLHRSHEVALNQGLLDGYKVHVTKKVLPDPSQMKDIIQSAKGEFLSSMPRGKEDKVFVISCKEDRGVCKKPLEAGIPVVSAEVLLTGILRQELNLEEFKLFEDELSDTSQDTTSSSGTNKRRREQSETATPPSVAEKKSSGSKRRKK